ncbi:TcaA second domain-containing protein [Nosocomiicoccus ampullae]|uniref:Membrane protein YvbJ n=1 Tax=Nosocomiicoccus ampullae TaxID=489910 RepID=A0A9Q2CYV9_9STAP|nr:zinc-ribbon domain-containing protein [Nosocomiicoccus ampullae]MBB5175442.1 putative membrane protein YvbJ [Nosocomiicoccus ampullae]QYA46855.1 zinc-ribbon domain-containing protein [Nosocomiicoccus ampullae]
MKFCKKCGQELRENVKVCTNCGALVDSNSNGKSETKSVPDQASKKPIDPKIQKRNKLIGIIVGAVLVVIIALYLLGSNLSSPERTVDKIVEAVENNDVSKLKSAIDTDISDDEANAYFVFINDKHGKKEFLKDVDQLKKDFNQFNSGKINNGTLELLSVNNDGKKWLLFDNYTFEIPKYQVKVLETDSENNLLSNIKEFKYTMDGKERVFKGEDTFAELIPGIYEFEGTAILENDVEATARIVPKYSSYDGNMVPAKFIGDFYFVELRNDYGYIPYESILKSFEKPTIQLNGNEIEVQNKEGNKDRFIIGPLAYGKEYELNAIVEHDGEKIEAEPIKFNFDENSIEDSKTYDTRDTVALQLKYEDDIKNAIEKEKKKEENERNHEKFEADKRGEIESFIRNFQYALEEMYDVSDYAEVEDFVKKDSEMEKALKKNIESGNFKNMSIIPDKFSHFEDKGDNKYSIRLRSDIKHDGLDTRQEFTTGYDLIYDKKQGGLKITNYQDL